MTPRIATRSATRDAIMAGVWLVIGTLIAITLVFAGIRVATDLPMILSGQPPESDDFEARYVAASWLAYLHIIPGVIYLVGAPIQLHRGFRQRHLSIHRALGRVLLLCGLISGVFALAFGIPFSFGGAFQSLATAVFGSWFLVCLVRAYTAIRRRDVQQHRRWMIRAFAVGLGVGTIRLWVGLFVAVDAMPLSDSFAVAFWLALGMHVIAGEVWLRWAPSAPRGARSSSTG
ncbi:DUF2306 domain-containing protein [Microbacterium sp.]|uniref:DUF2306 domain-containing protein n=1 Tax=Microbacterium sp. TaxID=51671 RepID=UPI002810BB92|nr:DUF2306 domain-containing protein [Microbacterium sp.]